MNSREMKAFYVDLGARITEARVEAQMTQLELAEAIGMARSSVSNIEAGRQRVPAHVVASISYVLGVKVDGLSCYKSVLGMDLRAR